MSGVRASASVQLIDTAAGNTSLPVYVGSRSMLALLEREGEVIRLGFVFERVDRRDSESVFTATLWFFDDASQIYLSRGTAFDLWYSDRVGHGVIYEVLPTGNL